MFCPNCGKKQQKGAHFCQDCGARVDVKWQNTKTGKFDKCGQGESERNHHRGGRAEEFQEYEETGTSEGNGARSGQAEEFQEYGETDAVEGNGARGGQAEEFQEHEETGTSEGNGARSGYVEEFTGQEKTNGRGIVLHREFASIQQLGDRAVMSQKIWKWVWIVLGVLFAYFSFRTLVSAVSNILNGEYGWIWAVETIAALGLIASGVPFLLFKILMPWKKRKCEDSTQEMLKVIQVNDRQEFMWALEQVPCSCIRRVYMDENGDVCIQGKYGRYKFVQTEDGMELEAQKENYKTALEGETIAWCLLKYLAPDAPINSYENERRNVRLAKSGWISVIFTTVFVVCCALVTADSVLGLGGSNDDGYRYVRLVKRGHPESYPDVCYEDAFKSFFAKRHWKYFRSTDKRDVVEFHGTCSYDGRPVNVKLQFVVSYEKGTFTLHAMDMDGEEQPFLFMCLLVAKVFEDYGSTVGDPGEMGIDDLYGTDWQEDDWDISDWDIGGWGENNLNEGKADTGNADADNGTADNLDANDLDVEKNDLTEAPGQDMSFLEGSYARSSGPKCGLSIWSADESGISFAMGIGTSGYLAYVDLRDLTAEWADADTAVYTSGNYSMTFTIQEDGSIWLRESEPWDTEFPLNGDYYKGGLEGEYAEYVFPDSDESYITIAEFNMGKSASECKIGRNEIYARHGRRFNDAQLQAYFDGCSWYTGTTEPEEFSEDLLNEIERDNLQAILDYETSMGYR